MMKGSMVVQGGVMMKGSIMQSESVLDSIKVRVFDGLPQSQYSSTTNSRMCGVLDIPPVSSAIIWARQVWSGVVMM